MLWFGFFEFRVVQGFRVRKLYLLVEWVTFDLVTLLWDYRPHITQRLTSSAPRILAK